MSASATLTCLALVLLHAAHAAAARRLLAAPPAGGQISVGEDHVCSLNPAGEAYCWGRNNLGQLGDGTTVDKSLPTLAAPPANATGPVAYSQISAGTLTTCAIATDGRALCWGASNKGQLGINGIDPSFVPVYVAANATWSQISAGFEVSCGVQSDGSGW
jgi:alpha-tubulin suppressor-like RCC1 family protein